MFLSRNYRLIVAQRKFDVLNPRSEASRVNMLGLRTKNFQGAASRQIVPRHKHSIMLIVHRSIFFRALVPKSHWIIFNFFRRKPWNVNFKNNTNKNPFDTVSIVHFSIGPLVNQNIFADEHYHPGTFLGRTLYMGWYCLSAHEVINLKHKNRKKFSWEL